MKQRRREKESEEAEDELRKVKEEIAEIKEQIAKIAGILFVHERGLKELWENGRS